MYCAKIYTDGSCHTQQCIGGWASIVLIEHEKIILSGGESNTTHNRMEITAVIKAIEYIQAHYKQITTIQVVSDSQYVIGLVARQTKLITANFTTKKGNVTRNIDLVKHLLYLNDQINLQFVKIKAHQKQTNFVNHNIEVDKLARKIVREQL